MGMGKECGECLYWKPLDETGGFAIQGECRRYAPSPMVFREDSNEESKNFPLVVWPATDAYNVCGDFQLKSLEWL